MIVLDANILIRAVLGQRVRTLLEDFSSQGVRFYSPDIAFIDAGKYLLALLKKRGKPDADLGAAIQYLQNIVESVDNETYDVFQREATERLQGRDGADWPILATQRWR
jgi:predicted nucleic acid-binding protein